MVERILIKKTYVTRTIFIKNHLTSFIFSVLLLGLNSSTAAAEATNNSAASAQEIKAAETKSADKSVAKSVDAAAESSEANKNVNEEELSVEEQLDRQQEMQSLLDARQRLGDIAEAKKAKSALVKEQLRALRNATTDEQKKEIQAQLDTLRQELEALDKSFDQISTGGVQLGDAGKVQAKGFNWKADLDDVLQPIFQSLKEITEKPRETEKLRSKSIFYKNRIEIVKKGLTNIDKVSTKDLSPVVKTQLQETETNWEEMLKDSEREYGIAQFQLNERRNSNNSFLTSSGKALGEFFSGRGLNVILGLIAFIVVFIALSYAQKWLVIWARPEIRKGGQALAVRLSLLTFKIFTYVIAFGAVIMVFYVKGDWILLGITIIASVALLLVMKNSIITYVDEVKLILNIGSVRQGERIFYNGLPWILGTISVYPTLINPALSGGTIRIKLQELVNLNSRPVLPDEPWFPTKQGDYVMIGDTTNCQVILQTPGVVKVTLGGGSVKHYNAADFYNLGIRNLSAETFAVGQTFGLDYSLQNIAITEIPEILSREIKATLSLEPYAESLKELILEFETAAASSLNYKVVAVMNGNAAQFYSKIARDIQKACVDTANREGWNIPFNQVTVNQGNGFKLLSEEAKERLLSVVN